MAFVALATLRSDVRASGLPGFSVTTYLYTKGLSIATAPDVIMTAEIYRGGVMIANATERAGPAETQTFVELRPTSPSSEAFVLPGDRLVVSTSGGDATTIDLPLLFADFDPARRELLGQASPGMEINFRLQPPPTGDRIQPPIDIGSAKTDQNGGVTLPWPQDVPFATGAMGLASIQTTGGHTIATQFAPFSCQPVVGSASVFGQASLGSDISVELTKPSGLTVQKWITASVNAVPASDPAWEINLGSSDWSIEPGSFITVTQRFGGLLILQRMSRVVPNLTLVVDLPGNEVRGLAPIGAMVEVSAGPVRALRTSTSPNFVSSTLSSADSSYHLRVSSSQIQRGWNVIATLANDTPLKFQAEKQLRLIRVFEYGNAIVSYVGFAARLVTATVASSAGTPKYSGESTTNRDGYVTFSMRNSIHSQGDPVFEPGDRIEMTISDGDPVVLTVPRITSRYDVDTDAVYGVAPAGAVLRITRGETINMASAMSQADPAGNYRVDVSRLASGPVNDVKRAQGYVVLETGSGAEIYLPWSAITLDISLGASGLKGIGPAGRLVQIEILDAQKNLVAKTSTIADAQGTIGAPGTQWISTPYDPIGRMITLRTGQWVHLDIGDDQLDFEIPELLAASSLRDNSIVGQAPAGTPVTIGFHSLSTFASARKTARTDQHGMFRVSASPEWTIRPGDHYFVFFTTSQGHMVSFTFTNPFIEVDLDKSSLIGYLAPKGRGVVVLGRPARPLEWREARSDAAGSYSVDFADPTGLRAPIPARSQLRVISDTISGEVLVSTRVPTLTLEVEQAEKTIHGLAQPGGSLWLQASTLTQRIDHDSFGTWGRGSVPVQADGTYSIPFGALSVVTGLPGISPTASRAVRGQQIMARLTSSDNNVFVVSKTTPLLDVSLGGALVCITADPGLAASLELHASNGDLVGEAAGMTTVGGLTSLALRDKAGRLLRTQPGQLLVAHVGRETTERVIPTDSYTVTWDVPNSGGKPRTRFTGQRPQPLSRSYFSIGTHSCEAMLASGDKQGTLIDSWTNESDAKGVVNISLAAARPGHFAQAAFYGESGDLFTYRARRLQASVLVDTGKVEGAASPVSDVEITLTRQNLPRPIIGHAVSDEKGKFNMTLLDESGDEFSIRPGDVLLLASENQTATVGVEHLDFDFSNTSGLMVNLPANRIVHIKLTLSDGSEVQFDRNSDTNGRVIFGPIDLPSDAGWVLDDVARIALAIDTPGGHIMRAEAIRGAVRAPTSAPVPQWSQVFMPRVLSARR